jgi:metal-responsive CopG/Arc/MetJ family transcriptional regulator
MYPQKKRSKNQDDGRGSTRIMLTIDTLLLKQIDTLAKQEYAPRSVLVRRALVEYIRQPQNELRLASEEAGEDLVLKQMMENLKNAGKE